MPTNRDILKTSQASHVASTAITDAPAAVAAAHRRIIQFQVFDGGTAGTAFTESANFMPHACKVISAYITAPVAVATNGTNYVTLTLAKRTAGAAATSVATLGTSAVAWAALTPAALTLTASATELAASDSLTVKVEKVGTGQAISAATSHAVVTVVVEEI